MLCVGASFAVWAGVGAGLFWLSPHKSWLGLAVMLSMPLLASLVLLILTILMPSFFSAPKMTWPLACAWPITSAAVLYGLHLLSIGDAWSMIRIEGVPRFDLLWGDWLPLGVSAIAQFVILLFLPAENSEEEDA